jgi:glycosyltransferase involved in cell wall biosynthesis
MKLNICHVDPACGLNIPPKNWGAIEKIIWEFEINQTLLGHNSTHKLEAKIQPGEFDIVHCHVANLTKGLRERGIPYIYQLHDHHVLHYGPNSNVYKENLEAIEGSLISLMPANWLVDYFNHPKCVYFSHGVNIDEFYPKEIIKPTPANPKLLMLANNGLGGDEAFDRKGFEYGLGLAMINNLEITIAGPSNNKNFFNNHIWMLNYPKLNLVFDTPNTKLLDLYHHHDIFIHPTMLEAGHPNLTMLEALAAGLPVIADWEMEVDLHGCWRSPRNIFEMDKGLKDILNIWSDYREKGLETATNLSWLNRTKELIKIYKNHI